MDAYTKAKLDYLADTKQAIKVVLNAKGLSVADTDTFRSYAEKLAAIDVAEPVENGSF